MWPSPVKSAPKAQHMAEWAWGRVLASVLAAHHGTGRENEAREGRGRKDPKGEKKV